MNQEQTNITTGKQIRHLRTQLGMTQEELAGELNVTRQALSNWERDVNEPDLNMLKKICFLFGVNRVLNLLKHIKKKISNYKLQSKFVTFVTNWVCLSVSLQKWLVNHNRQLLESKVVK